MDLSRQGNPLLGLIRYKAGPRAVDFTRVLVLTGEAWRLRKRSEGKVQVKTGRWELRENLRSEK